MADALGDALAFFYPLAGRIRQEKGDGGALYVDGEEGAEVVEAAAEGVSVDELAGEACGEEAERLMQQLIPYTGVMNLEGLHRPLLAVQVCRISQWGSHVVTCVVRPHRILEIPLYRGIDYAKNKY
jgi:BAHD acyltransferase